MVTLYFRGGKRQRDQSLLKQPLPVPPPEWIHNASCYTPRLLNDDDAVMKYTVSVADVSKARSSLQPWIEMLGHYKIDRTFYCLFAIPVLIRVR